MEIKYRNNLADVFIGSFRTQVRHPLIWISFVVTTFFSIKREFSSISDLVSPAVRSIASIISGTINNVLFWILVLLVVCGISAVLRCYGLRRGNATVEHRFKFDEESFVEETDFNKTESRWSSVHKISQNHFHVYIYLDRDHYFAVPKRIFASAKEASQFFEFLKSKIPSHG